MTTSRRQELVQGGAEAAHQGLGGGHPDPAQEQVSGLGGPLAEDGVPCRLPWSQPGPSFPSAGGACAL